jgi:DNA-binding transcriptional regulator YiaG
MEAAEVMEWRRRHHLTQAQLARYLDVDVITVSRWERGIQRIPGMLTLALERLDQTLEVSDAHA